MAKPAVHGRGHPGQGHQVGLHEFLARHGLVYDRSVTATVEHVVAVSRWKSFLLTGPPGSGKTVLATMVAEWLGARLVYYQATYGTSEEDLIYKLVPDDSTKSGIRVRLGPLPEALYHSRKGPVVLLIDEFDKTRPNADALLLDFLQNHRLSLYLHGRTGIVQGDPRNLIVFLTSNDERELSEALLRRLVRLDLKPVPPGTVASLLANHYGLRRETAALLASIYKDTHEARLRKPATIQELVQVGRMIDSGYRAPLDSIVRMFIVKYDDDWRKYLEHLGHPDNLEEVYSSVSFYTQEEVEAEQGKSNGLDTLLERVRSVLAEAESLLARNMLRVEDQMLVHAKITMYEEESPYSVVAHLFPWQAGDNPARIGKFELAEDDTGRYMIAREPLTPYEYTVLASFTVGEVYLDTRIIAPVDLLERLAGDQRYEVRLLTRDRLVASRSMGNEVVYVADVRREARGDGYILARVELYERTEASWGRLDDYMYVDALVEQGVLRAEDVARIILDSIGGTGVVEYPVKSRLDELSASLSRLLGAEPAIIRIPHDIPGIRVEAGENPRIVVYKPGDW